MIELNTFQMAAMRTVDPRLQLHEIVCMCGLGIGGESGELVDPIKKMMFHGKPLDREHMLLEMGDMLWYVAVLANTCGYTLQQVANANEAKLSNRHGHNMEKFAGWRIDPHTMTQHMPRPGPVQTGVFSDTKVA